jgi:hypothetical protein
MNAAAAPSKVDEARALWKLPDEPNRIFATIQRKTGDNEH